MKVWLKGTISIFLGMLILVTGSGISLAKMVCLKSGYTQITLNTPDECCKHEHEHAPVTIESKCCDITSMNVDILHYLVSSSQHLEKSMVWIEITLFQFSSLKIETPIASTDHQYQYPPELSSPDFFVLTKTFLI